jgi:hypothetical protein
MTESTPKKTQVPHNYWYLYILGGMFLNFPFGGFFAFTGLILMTLGVYKLLQILIKNPNLGGSPQLDRILRTGLAILGAFLLILIKVIVFGPDEQP